MKVSKKLFVLPFLVFAMSSCGKTPEDGSKDNEKDKQTAKTQVVIPQLFSGETGTTPLENFIYDGTEKHVHLEGVVSDKVKVKTESVFSATNAGEYSVVVSLKDTSKTCWKDKTTADKTFNWEIEKFDISGSSDGFCLSVGSFVGESRDVTLSMNEEEVENPATLKLEFKLYNPEHAAYEWQQYDDATFTPETSNLSIDTDGKLVVSDTSVVGGLLVGTSNPNHTFSQHFSLSFFEYRTITFVAGDLTQETSPSDAHGSTELAIDDTKLLPSEEQQRIKFNYEYAPYSEGEGYTYLTQNLGYFENDFSTPIRSIKSIKVKGSYSRVGIKWGWSNGVDAINWRSYDDFFVDTPAEVFEFNNEKPNYFRVYALSFNTPAIKEVQISFYDSVQESEDPYYEIDGLKYHKHAEYAECLGFAGSSVANVVVEDAVGGVPVTTISEDAFRNNTTIESINLGANVRIIKPNAFYETYNLTTVTGLNNVTKVGANAFNASKVEGDLAFSSNLEEIGTAAFMGAKLSSVTFSDEGNPTVYDAAFRNMANLVSIHIGSEMTNFRDDLTYDYKLESITVGEGNTTYSVLDNVLLDDHYHKVISFAGNRPETSFTVPSGYTLSTYCAYGNKTLEEIHLNDTDSRVPDYAFNFCEKLKTIDFGSYPGLTIQDSFKGCTALQSLVISSNVKAIWQRAFQGCTSLDWVEFEEGCTTLHREAFANCTKLNHVILPTTLTRIGEQGGWADAPTDVFNGCTALTTVLTRLELGNSYSGTILDGWYGSRTLLFQSDVSDPYAWHEVNGAPTAYATRTLYIQSSGTYDVDGAWMAVWAWNTKYDGYFFYDHSAPVDHLYSIELPLNYRCLTILRMQAGVDATDYTTNFPSGKVHNQSPSFLLKATEDEGTITGWGLDVSWGTHSVAI